MDEAAEIVVAELNHLIKELDQIRSISSARRHASACDDPYPRYWTDGDANKCCLYRVRGRRSTPEGRRGDGSWQPSLYYRSESDLNEDDSWSRYYPWTGDGSEEPPEHVRTVRDRDGYTLTRTRDGWDDSWSGRVDPWYWTYERQGPYTEVMDNIEISDEAREFYFRCGCERACGREGYEEGALPFIVAAELERLVEQVNHRAVMASTFGEGPKGEGYASGIETARNMLIARAAELKGMSDE